MSGLPKVATLGAQRKLSSANFHIIPQVTGVLKIRQQLEGPNGTGKSQNCFYIKLTGGNHCFMRICQLQRQAHAKTATEGNIR